MLHIIFFFLKNNLPMIPNNDVDQFRKDNISLRIMNFCNINTLNFSAIVLIINKLLAKLLINLSGDSHVTSINHILTN